MGEVSPEDEYRERWEYLRHAEEVRYRIIQWYFLVVGGVLAFGIGKAVDYAADVGESVAAILGTYSGAGTLVLFLLTCYSVAILGLLVSQKKAYNSHATYLKHLDGEAVSTEKGDLPKWPGADAFLGAYSSVAFVGAAIVGTGVLMLCLWLNWAGWFERALMGTSAGVGAYLATRHVYKEAVD